MPDSVQSGALEAGVPSAATVEAVDDSPMPASLASDRELLKLAAKQAGIDMVNQSYSDSIYVRTGGLSWKHWNPLTDDGDAFRLAAKLNIYTEVLPESTYTFRQDSEDYWREEHRGDALAATRRAIVRAAARK